MMDISKEQWLKLQQNVICIYLVFHWVIPCAVPIAIVLPIIRGIAMGYSAKYFISIGFIKNIVLFLVLYSIISLNFGIRKWNKCIRIYSSELKSR